MPQHNILTKINKEKEKANVSVLTEKDHQDIKQPTLWKNTEISPICNEYEFLPDSSACFWDGYWSPSVFKK